MTTLKVIAAELDRQRNRPGTSFKMGAMVMGPYKADPPQQAHLEGWVDLAALAEAIDRRGNRCAHE